MMSAGMKEWKMKVERIDRILTEICDRVEDMEKRLGKIEERGVAG